MKRMDNFFNKPEEIDESLFDNNEIGSSSGGSNNENEFVPDQRWETYKSFLPEQEKESFKLPEDISKENEEELLLNAFKGVFKDEEKESNNGLHPLAASLQKSVMEKGEEFNPVEWFREMQTALDVEGMQSMKDEDIVRDLLISQHGLKSEENPKGFTQEQFDDYISKMDAISLRQKANEVREVKVKASENLMKFENPKPMEVEEIKKIVDSDLEKIIKSEKALDVAGYDIRKAIDDETLKEISNMFVPEKVGALSLIQQKLSNPEWYSNALVKLAYLETKSGSEMINHMLSEKETRLKHLELIQKLDDDPRFGSSFKNQQNPNKIDEDLFG
jgi:hypothetical protein